MWIFREWKDPITALDPEIILIDVPASDHRQAQGKFLESIMPSNYSIEECVETKMVIVITFKSMESSYRYTRIFYVNYRQAENGILVL